MRYFLSFALGFLAWSLACLMAMLVSGTYKDMGVYTFPVFVAAFSWGVYVTRDRAQLPRAVLP